MAVDFYAVMKVPVPVADIVTTSASIQAELLGLDHVPPNQVLSAGQLLDRERLTSLMLGPGHPDPHLAFAGGDTELAALQVSALPGDWVLVVSPRTTARGIVTGLSVALAAALLGEGQVVDNDLRLTDNYENDVAGFVAAHRLWPCPRDLDEAYLAFVRQFRQLRDWPPI